MLDVPTEQIQMIPLLILLLGLVALLNDSPCSCRREPFALLLRLSAGVIRENCTYMTTWQAYKCLGLNYRMLVIESLDSDTETRRLSPVAVLSGGFVDLINGRTGIVLWKCKSWRQTGKTLSNPRL